VDSVLRKRAKCFEKCPASLFLGILCNKKNENKFFWVFVGYHGGNENNLFGYHGINFNNFVGYLLGIKRKMKMKTRTSKQNKL